MQYAAELFATQAPPDMADRLVCVTQAASRAAAEWTGKGDKNAADQAAVDAMRQELIVQGISCEEVNGEGEKDGAPELEQGSIYGDVFPPKYDLADDPIDGTTFLSKDMPGAISAAALVTHGNLMPYIGVPYMKKLVVGPRAAHLLDTPLEHGGVSLQGDEATNMRRVAAALGKPVTELVVAMLDRPRNDAIRKAAEDIGAQILSLEGCDIIPALQPCIGGEVDMLYSSGGVPEGVLTAAAIAALPKNLRGNMQAKMDPRPNTDDAEKAIAARSYGRILTISDMVGDGEVYFAATGITPSALLTGAHKFEGIWYPGSSIKLSRPAKTNGHAVRSRLLLRR